MLKSKTKIIAHYYSRWRKEMQPHRVPIVLLLLTFGLYFIRLFSNMLIMKPDGLHAGHVHVWGDWSLHISMAHIFAYKDPSDWLAYHPYFADGRFTYGFATNMISGLLIRAGFSLTDAFIVPSIIFSLFLVVGIYACWYQVLRSRFAAITALCLFFFSSGLGFFRFLPDWQKNPTLETFLSPSRDYSRLEQYQWLAGNFLNGMLIPQRAFLLGMAIAVWSLYFFWLALNKPHTSAAQQRRNQVLFGISGVLAGVLPIVHMHSLIALVVIMGLTSLAHLRHRWLELLALVIPAGAISAFLFFIFIAGGIENPDFMKIMIGWSSPKGVVAWLIMWWKIWGLFLPTALVSLLLLKKRSAGHKLFFLSFIVIFGLGNIILFQPVQWDNSKLFLWTYFGLTGSIALLLEWLWDHSSLLIKTAALTLFVLLSLTGVMELWRLQRFDKNSVFMSNLEDINMGAYLRANTDPRARFLTNSAHNHPVSMWGARAIVMGYPTWAWNFGFLIDKPQQDMKDMYAGSDKTLELLKKYRIDFVAIGSGEIHNFHANETFFRNHFPVWYISESYRIYDVRDDSQ